MYVNRHIHEREGLSREAIAGIVELVSDMPEYHWKFQSIVSELSRHSRAELGNPIILYEASRTQSFVRIPRSFCTSPKVSCQHGNTVKFNQSMLNNNSKCISSCVQSTVIDLSTGKLNRTNIYRKAKIRRSSLSRGTGTTSLNLRTQYI